MQLPVQLQPDHPSLSLPGRALARLLFCSRLSLHVLSTATSNWDGLSFCWSADTWLRLPRCPKLEFAQKRIWRGFRQVFHIAIPVKSPTVARLRTFLPRKISPSLDFSGFSSALTALVSLHPPVDGLQAIDFRADRVTTKMLTSLSPGVHSLSFFDNLNVFPVGAESGARAQVTVDALRRIANPAGRNDSRLTAVVIDDSHLAVAVVKTNRSRAGKGQLQSAG
jgi:hypothetical protein